MKHFFTHLKFTYQSTDEQSVFYRLIKKTFVLQLILLSIVSKSYSQVCTTCTSEDVKIVNISLLYDPLAACPDSNTIINHAKINISLTITSKKRYGFYMYYELWIDGKPASPFYYKKCFPLDLPQGNVTLPLIDLPPFAAKQKLEIRNVLTAWDNNAPVNGVYFCENLDGYACNTVAPKCKYYNVSFPIKVDLKPAITSITSNNNICPGGNAVFNIKGTPLAKLNYLLNNVADSLTLDSTGNAIVTKSNALSDVTLVVKSIATNTCSAQFANNTATVKVNSVSTPGKIIGSQRICYGTDPTIIISSESATGIGAIHYQWQKKTATGTWTNIAGATSESLDDNSLIFEDTWYRRLTIADGCNELASNEILVTLYQFYGGSVSGDQIICPNSTPIAFTSIQGYSGGSFISYQWQESFDSGATWVDINGATLETYQETEPISVATYYRRKAASLFTDKICYSYTNIIKVDIVEINAAGTIASDQTICPLGDPVTFTTATPTLQSIGLFQYQWQYSLDGGNWINIENANNEFYDPPARTITQKTYYRRGITMSTNILGCNNDFSNIVTIDITQIQSPGAISADQIVCKGSVPATLTSTSDASINNGIASYQWQSSTDGLTWNNIDLANDINYNASAITEQTFFRRLAVASSNNEVCSTDSSNLIKIDIATIQDAGSISGDQYICNNDKPEIIGSVSDAIGNGSILYTWEFSKDGGNTWQIISSANDMSFQSSNLNANTQFRRNAYITLSNEICGNNYSNTVSVIIGKISSAGQLSGSDLVCLGGNPSPFKAENPVTNTPSAFVKYQWQISNDKGITWTNIANATDAVYDENTPVWSKMLYRRIANVTNISGNVCEQLISNQVSIDVRECERCNLLNEYTKGFPNPFKYNFTLRFRSCITGPALIEIFDFAGAKIQEKKFANVQAGQETIYEVFLPQSLTGAIYKITSGKYSTVGRMITAY